MSAVAEHNPGGTKRWPLQAGVTGDAVFSECGKRRYLLTRQWAPGPRLMIIGQNPSTAAKDIDDPTIRRGIEFARRLNLCGLIMANAMDYRATYPSDLLAPGVAPCSDLNLPAIIGAAADAQIIIAAWGNMHKQLQVHGKRTAHAITARGHKLWCFGVTANGSPRHPLYVKGDTKLVPYQ